MEIAGPKPVPIGEDVISEDSNKSEKPVMSQGCLVKASDTLKISESEKSSKDALGTDHRKDDTNDKATVLSTSDFQKEISDNINKVSPDAMTHKDSAIALDNMSAKYYQSFLGANVRTEAMDDEVSISSLDIMPLLQNASRETIVSDQGSLSQSPGDDSVEMSEVPNHSRTCRTDNLMEDTSRIPKRKSGSLSEMVLTKLPLKKQKPEICGEVEFTPQEKGPTNENKSTCAAFSDTVPSLSTGLSQILSTMDVIPKTSNSQRNILLDKQNPPFEILNWIATFTQWAHPEKLLALEQLIETCEPQQVRHMVRVIEPQFQRDFISLLPKELALYVLGYLEPRDLLRAAQTCQYWRILAEDNLLWREKCEEAGLSNCQHLVTQETIRRRSKIDCSFLYSTWKAGFLKQHRTEMNLRQNPIQDPKVLKGHDDHVITCLEFSDNKIVSGSDDNTLKVWCALSGKCLRTLVGHTGGVWTSQMNNNFIISGSTDRTLKVWNADNGECLHTLRGHTSTVRCMHLHAGVIVSGSRDATLRMWDVLVGECLHVLVGHVAAVRCVQYDGRLVVSGGYDYMVKVWNPETEECLHTLVGHTNRVYSLQFDGVHVISGSLDTCIRVWDVETGACKHTLMGHQSLTSGMELRDNVLVSGNADSTVKIWNILTGSCLQTLAGPNKHGSAVTSIQFNDKFVVTSSDDGTVKLWDVKTGEFIRDLVALESGGAGGVVWRIRMKDAKLVCAVGSRNGTEETKLLVLNFDTDDVE